ncbi:MAG: diguanylate cyclase [Candidatus Nitrospinota bacterium M3_3B_026]
MNSESFPGGEDVKLLDLARQHSRALAECMMEVFALYNLSKSLHVSFHMDSIFHEAEELMKNMLGVTKFAVMLLDESSSALRMWRANSSTYEAAREVTFKLGEGVCGHVAQTGEAELVRDVSKDERFLYYKGAEPEIGSFYSTPLRTRSGRVIGVLNVSKEEVNAIGERDLLVYNAVATSVAQALENSKLFSETQKQAITDSLTGLYSRRYFTEIMRKEISKARRDTGVFSLIMMDVDHFKDVNDTYGHLVGDDVLKKIGGVLKKNTRQEDVMARYGGEEFVVLLPGISVADALFVAEKLRGAVKEEAAIQVEGEEPRNVTISGGVSCYPESGKTMEQIIDAADRALYSAKTEGRDRIGKAPGAS